MSARVIFALGDSDWDWSSVGLTDEFNLAHRALLEPPRVSLDRIMFVFNTKPLALFNLGVHVVPLVVLVRRRLVELDSSSLITVFVSTLNSSKLSYVPPYSNSTNPFMINLNPTRRQHQHRLNPTHVALLSALRSLKISFELQVQLNSEAHLSPEVPGLAVDLRVAAVVNATLRHRTFNAAIDFDSPQAVKRMHSKFVEYRFVAT
ncbi:hypothetical protein DFH06DRAFT_1342888 [Mycena polygramma]|nr:hypothetical protein DFH06DRAFT_1342888 [Mycena polygramma]